MKTKKQIIIPIVVGTSLAAAAAPAIIVGLNKNQPNPVNYDLFNVKNGTLYGFKETVTNEQISEYIKGNGGKLYLPECKIIATGAFRDSPFGDTIVIPDETLEVGPYAFYGNTASEVQITSGSQLQKIGAYAFASCENLTSFPFPSIYATSATPEKPFEIGDYAFANCKSLRTLDFTNFGTVVSDVKYFDATQATIINENISIGDGAFIGLQTKTVPEPLILKVCDFADEYMDVTDYGSRFALSGFATKLQLEMELWVSRTAGWVEGVTASESKFSVCTVVPTDWFTTDGTTLTGINPEFKPYFSLLTYSALQIPSGIKTIAPSFWLDIPEVERNAITDLDLYGSGLVELPNRFFVSDENKPYLQKVRNVRLPLGLTSIGDQAFYAGSVEDVEHDYSDLKWVNLNALTHLTSIGTNAFTGNAELWMFDENPDENEVLENNAFEINCSRDTNLTIKTHAFTGTGIRNINFVNMPTDVANFNVDIENEAFEGLNLHSISFDDSFNYVATTDNTKVTIDSNDVLTSILNVLFPEDDHSKAIFKNVCSDLDYDEETGTVVTNFIKIPGWSGTGVQDVYPDLDYYLYGAGEVVDGGRSRALFSVIGEQQDGDHGLNFAQWNIVSDPVALNVTTTSADHIKFSNPPQKVQAGQELVLNYTAQEGYAFKSITVTIGGMAIKSGWYFQRDPQDATIKQIVIPGNLITGDVDVVLSDAEIGTITPTEAKVTVGSEQIQDPGDVNCTPGVNTEVQLDVAVGYKIDTTASIITVTNDGATKELQYAKNWTVQQNQNGNWTLIIYGETMFVGLSDVGISLYASIDIPEKFNTELQFDSNAFKTAPTLGITSIDYGQSAKITAGELNENYRFETEGCVAEIGKNVFPLTLKDGVFTLAEGWKITEPVDPKDKMTFKIATVPTLFSTNIAGDVKAGNITLVSSTLPDNIKEEQWTGTFTIVLQLPNDGTELDLRSVKDYPDTASRIMIGQEIFQYESTGKNGWTYEYNSTTFQATIVINLDLLPKGNLVFEPWLMPK